MTMILPRRPDLSLSLQRPLKIASRRWLALGLIALSLATMTSCGREGDLTGSMERFYDLSYAQVRARHYPSELAIEYVREDGQVPVRVTVRTDQIKVGQQLNLLEVGTISGRTRETDLPDPLTGSITIDAFEKSPGSNIQGSFEASFSVGQDKASLSGRFNTQLEVIEAVDGYDLGYKLDMGSDMQDMPAAAATD